MRKVMMESCNAVMWCCVSSLIKIVTFFAGPLVSIYASMFIIGRAGRSGGRRGTGVPAPLRRAPHIWQVSVGSDESPLPSCVQVSDGFSVDGISRFRLLRGQQMPRHEAGVGNGRWDDG